MSDLGRDFFEQFDPLCPHRRFFDPETGNVATGTLQALYEALRNRVGNHNHDDGNGAGSVARGLQVRRRIDHQDVGSQRDKLARERLRKAGIAGGPAIVDLDIAPRLPFGVRFGSKSGKARPEHLLSASPPKADIDWHPIDVRLVPQADIAGCNSSTFVGAQVCRHRDPQAIKP